MKSEERGLRVLARLGPLVNLAFLLNKRLFITWAMRANILHDAPPDLERMLDRIRQNGKASRTHFSPSGFKTDLSLKELLALYPEVS